MSEVAAAGGTARRSCIRVSRYLHQHPVRITLHTHPRELTGAPKPPQLGSMSWWTGEAAQSTRLDDPRPSGPRARPSPASGGTSRWHHGRRRELPCVATLLPRAAFRQPLKAAFTAALDSLLPHTWCSLRSGCAVDERLGASPHSSTVCGQVRAGKLTWASLSVVQHSATASALVRARMYLSAACSMTLLQPCRLAVPAIQRRGGVRRYGLKQYSERNALAVLLALCWRACAMRVAGWYRKTDLTRIVRKRQICAT